MYVVCEDLSNGMYRAVDTSDWTEEIVSVLQLKLLESMGYFFIFDERYNFISNLFSLSAVHNSSFDDMRNLGFYVPYNDSSYSKLISSMNNNVKVYCFARRKDIVLFNIQRNGDSYKLSYKVHDGKILDKGKIDFDSMKLYIFSSTCYKGGYFIELRYSINNEESKTRFDLECNQIRGK